MTQPPLHHLSATELAAGIRERRWSAIEVTDHFLDRIAEINPRLNAFSEVLTEAARSRAIELDAAQDRGESLGALHGVPLAIKEENDVAGSVTRLGGAANIRPKTADGHVVSALRAAGAVIIGKTHMPEFGIWPYTESEEYGITLNPWDPTRTPGGSSGGSAAAVASGMVPAAIGGDGGGSIRLPAAMCGLYGLKPQRGRVSPAPNPDLWRSLGTLGPLTRTVADSALIYDVIAGNTDSDRYRAEPWAQPLSEALTDVSARRILLVPENPSGAVAADADTLAALEHTAERLRELGHTVFRGSLPRARVTWPFLLQVAGGVRDESRIVEFPSRLEARTRAMVRIGGLSRFLDGWALRAGERASRTLNAVFDHVDLVLMPTAPGPAIRAGALTDRGFISASIAAAPAASFTSPWNLTGNPAAAIPSGFSREGLPLSVQLVGAMGSEPEIIAVSAQLERVAPWADRYPELGLEEPDSGR